jgi:secreted Zn-dependent insulinase-like peptidase
MATICINETYCWYVYIQKSFDIGFLIHGRITVLDEDNVFHQFSTGSKETLETIPAANGVDVYVVCLFVCLLSRILIARSRKQLLEFHEKHYVPENMRLCVLGKESLDDLQKLVDKVSITLDNV